MLKHMEDNADFNMLIDDSGILLVVCSHCHRVWTGKLTVAEPGTSAKKATYMLEAALRINPSLVKDLGMDAESIAALK